MSVENWPNDSVKILYRMVLTTDLLFVGFFFYSSPQRELQYVNREFCWCGGLVLLAASLLCFRADWRYASFGLCIGLFSVLLGLLPALS